MVISWLELQSSYLVLRRNIEASVENSYFIWDLFSYLIPHLIIFSLVPWDIGVLSFVLPPPSTSSYIFCESASQSISE